MTLIASLQNTQVKQIRALSRRGERERTGLFFVESPRAVIEAIQLHASLDTLVIAPALLKNSRLLALAQAQRRAGTPCLEVTPEVFESLVLKENRGGLAAVARQRWTALDQVPAHRDRCWIALEGVQYPGNLGTILRTSDAAGGAGVILRGRTADPFDPQAVRASAGAVFAQQLVRTTTSEFAAWRRRHALAVVGTSPQATTDYRVATYRQARVLLMGSEGQGLSAESQALCDELVRIPMVGRSDSLNLAVSTALVLYEIFRRQRPVGVAPVEVGRTSLIDS
jgi:TrmH family RNA methyltransferase